MHEIDRRRYEMLTRVRDFGVNYGHLFPESSLAARAFSDVTTALGAIETHDVARTVAAVSARAARKDDARRALEERLTLMARTAQVLDGVDAQLRAHFKLPDSPSDQMLLTVARQCVQHAAPVAMEFVAHAMPPTFLSDLDALIDRFEEALRDRGIRRSQLVAARAGIKEALSSAFTATRRLDVMVANHLTGNAAVREVWKRGRRIHYPAVQRRAPRDSCEGADG